ncbi:MAG: M3 family oligoendopeptidase [Ignavibacteriae bacterium]|nr:MAG: M3 family oligoendopeptidase [Ignavibacteriota bacterium]
MKFSDIKYERPDIKATEEKFNALLSKFENASTFEEQDEAMKEINNLRVEFQTNATVASIRYSIETTNKYNEEEQYFFDLNNPVYEGLITGYYKAIIKSKFRNQLEEKWGKQLFAHADLTIKTFSPEIVEDLKLENKLRTDYSKLLASAKIMFEGEERNLSGLNPFLESPDRDVRKRANEAKWNFFSENEEKFDKIYDDLVKLRDKMAKKLGYKNFVDMGYARMGRTDYNPEMVAAFRKQVLDYIVPLTLKLKQKQKERLGLDSFKYYDQPIDFTDGNAKPHGKPEWIVSNAKKMYEELSPETGEFFNFMVENEMMDLVTKQGKDTGGYCTFIEKYKSPFIFSNFNGTAGDIEVLTHEAGHAFQAFRSRFFDIPEYYFPTSEACEIHSMSMEYLTWPWMENFFLEETDKFKYSHLKGSMVFVPYGVTVDEFQHFVYENPDATPQERKQAWLDIEKKYLPYFDYEDNEFLNKGGRWQQQRHIYMQPFYYIDYCLAQICAFQFWKKSLEDRGNALSDYVRLCNAGGSQSFLNLVELANLESPFKEGSIKPIVKEIEKWLDTVKLNGN